MLGRPATHNSLAWRVDRWELVANYTIPIPYFGGDLIRMPYVLLRDRLTGREVWFANFHNPANTKKRGNNAKWRKKATQLELRLMNQLVSTGRPVVLTGDMNDRAEYFCPMTAGAPMAAAKGGSRGPGTCTLPAKPPIDWIFGSYDVGFTGYTEKRGSLVKKTTDHPLVYADATLDPTPPRHDAPHHQHRRGRIQEDGPRPGRRSAGHRRPQQHEHGHVPGTAPLAAQALPQARRQRVGHLPGRGQQRDRRQARPLDGDRLAHEHLDPGRR